MGQMITDDHPQSERETERDRDRDIESRAQHMYTPTNKFLGSRLALTVTISFMRSHVNLWINNKACRLICVFIFIFYFVFFFFFSFKKSKTNL